MVKASTLLPKPSHQPCFGFKTKNKTKQQKPGSHVAPAGLKLTQCSLELLVPPLPSRALGAWTIMVRFSSQGIKPKRFMDTRQALHQLNYIPRQSLCSPGLSLHSQSPCVNLPNEHILLLLSLVLGFLLKTGHKIKVFLVGYRVQNSTRKLNIIYTPTTPALGGRGRKSASSRASLATQ